MKLAFIENNSCNLMAIKNRKFLLKNYNLFMTYQYYTLEDLKAQPDLLENHPLNARFRLSEFITKKFRSSSVQDPKLRLLAQNHAQNTEVILFSQAFAGSRYFDKQGTPLDQEQANLLFEQRRYDERVTVVNTLYHGLYVWKSQWVVYFNMAISQKHQLVADREFEITCYLANSKASRLTLIGRYGTNGDIDYTVPYEYYYPALSSNEQAAISSDLSASVLHILEDIKTAIVQDQEHENYYFNKYSIFRDFTINYHISLETLTTRPAENTFALYPAEIGDYIQTDAHSGELGLPILNSLYPNFYKGVNENAEIKFTHTTHVFHSQQKNITFIFKNFPEHFSSKAPTLYKVYAIINRTWLVVFDFDKFFEVIFKEEDGKKIACFKLGCAMISVLADLRDSQPPLKELHSSRYHRNKEVKPLEDFSYSGNQPQPILQPFIKDLICDVKVLLHTLTPLLVGRWTIMSCFNQEKYEKALSLEELIYDAVEIDFSPSGISTPEISLKLSEYWLN